ncbi:hypothetical protein Bhyg_17603, partial [Pseudolycoriella hygida]
TTYKYSNFAEKLVKQITLIEFSDISYPSLREQILKSSKVFLRHPLFNCNYGLEKSTSDYTIIQMSSGRYLNFGVEKSLHTYLKSHPKLCFNNSCLELSMGIYVLKSKTKRGIELPKYLIIFGKIANISHQTTKYFKNTSFIVGIYDGTFPTPNIANEILRPFVDELKELTTANTIKSLNGHKISRISLHAFIVDPIAYSIFTCTSLPQSLNGCSKCRIKSELRVNRKNNSYVTIYPALCKMENLRIDEDFKYCSDSGYHLDVPIAVELNVGLVTRTSIDYKYTVCLGVMKQLVTLWTKGKLDYRINRKNWRKMLSNLQEISQNCPHELQKPVRYVDDIETWDAYHWKLFLVYFGPIVLHDNLPQNNKHPNNYVLSKKGIFEIKEIKSNCNRQILIVGRKFHCISTSYQVPIIGEKTFAITFP